MKRILINTVSKNEVRIFWFFKKNIKRFEILKLNKKKYYKYNIFLGKILKIDFGLEVIFINYGVKNPGILPFSKISKKFFFKKTNFLNLNILKKNNYLLVQILREEFLNKGALLTNIITVTGNYLILFSSSNKFKKIHFSKKIKKKYIKILRKNIKFLKICDNISLIVRYSAINCTQKLLMEDYILTYRKFKKIKKIVKKNGDFSLINKNFFFQKCLMYCLQIKTKKIVIDNKNLYKYLKKKLFFLNRIDLLNQLKFFSSDKMLKYFNLKNKIRSIFKKSVLLPSGGKIFFNINRSFCIIDVDSNKFSSKKNFECTAFFTNLEASYEISKQIQLRNLRGIIIIDFINMKYLINKKILEISLKEFFSKDESKIKFNKISKFGLLEIVRKKL